MTKQGDWEPNDLRKIWEWKDTSYREVAHLPMEEAIAELLRRAHREGDAFENRETTFEPTNGTD